LLEEKFWKNDAWFSFALECSERHCLELGAWNVFSALHYIKNMVGKGGEQYKTELHRSQRNFQTS